MMMHDYEYSTKTGFLEADWVFMPDVIPDDVMARKGRPGLTVSRSQRGCLYSALSSRSRHLAAAGDFAGGSGRNRASSCD